jgi:hypothetical protein
MRIEGLLKSPCWGVGMKLERLNSWNIVMLDVYVSQQLNFRVNRLWTEFDYKA